MSEQHPDVALDQPFHRRSRRWTMAALTLVLVAATLAPQVAPAASAQTGDCPSDPYAAASHGDADEVYFWNGVLLEAFRDEGGGPTPLARAAGMMHVGIYDVLNSVYFTHLEDLATDTPDAEVCGWEPYLVLARTTTGVDADLAVAIAARDILADALPGQASAVEAAFTTRHGSAFQSDAFALGTYVAHTVITARDNDGSDAPMPYTPDGVPGAWRPTEDPICPNISQAVTPGWGLVDPFTLTAGDQFRPGLPGGFTSYSTLLASQFYANQRAVVQAAGAYDASSTDRSADETEQAWFWANDLDDTYKPVGQHLDHAFAVADLQPPAATSGDPEDFETDWSQQGIRVARLFAQMGLALADAGIAAWDSKYRTAIDLWRPVTRTCRNRHRP